MKYLPLIGGLVAVGINLLWLRFFLRRIEQEDADALPGPRREPDELEEKKPAKSAR